MSLPSHSVGMFSLQIREDTEVLRPTTTLQTAASNIREDTEVLGNGVFGVREDTEVLNRTNNTGTGAFLYALTFAMLLSGQASSRL